MSKKFLIISILSSMILLLSSIGSFAAISKGDCVAVLTGTSMSGGNLNLEGDCNVDMIKVLVEKNGTQMWFDAEVKNGSFRKNILMDASSQNYKVCIMIHIGNYDFENGPQLLVNTSSRTITIVEAQKTISTSPKVENKNSINNITTAYAEVSNDDVIYRNNTISDFENFLKTYYLSDIYGKYKKSNPEKFIAKKSNNKVNNKVATNSQTVATAVVMPATSINEASIRTISVPSPEVNVVSSNNFASAAIAQPATVPATSVSSTTNANRNIQVQVADNFLAEYQRDGDLNNLTSKIIAGASNDMEKAKKIYDWVSNNISYDRQKYKKILNSDYSDKYGALVTLKSGKGVCYDYAAVVVELCTYAGISSKLIKGDYILGSGAREYHAWNEIYISELGRWISVDTTFGSVYRKDYFNNESFGTNHEKQEVEERKDIIRDLV